MGQERKFYLTRKGFKKIKKEYQTLKRVRHSKLKKSVFKSFNPSDLDPEYFTFHNDLNFLESRIIELENILRSAELIKIPPRSKRDIIDFGATVLVEVGGQTDEFEIVGTLEANPSLGKISNESPVGKALLGHRVGDEVVISSPIKTIYRIKKIRYPTLK